MVWCQKIKLTWRERIEVWAMYLFMLVLFSVFAYGMQQIIREVFN